MAVPIIGNGGEFDFEVETNFGADHDVKFGVDVQPKFAVPHTHASYYFTKKPYANIITTTNKPISKHNIRITLHIAYLIM